ncbi:TonB-dependent receptor plug domain-containing protein [Pedobacter panaciterrae]
MEIDKTVVNVDAMISSASSNTLEVLEKTPGIVVNSNGDITLNGRSGVMVLIDGRPTYMSGQDLSLYLKSLPGSLLDKIELMDNPPARYDASGNAIINIKLKKTG